MKEVLKNRTKTFVVDYWQLWSSFSISNAFNAFYNALIRCLSSLEENHKTASITKPNAGFINKLKIVKESMCFLQLLLDASGNEYIGIKKLHAETNELLPIVVVQLKQ